jgi:hypothetical protein
MSLDNALHSDGPRVARTCAVAVMLLMCGCGADIGKAPSETWPIMLGAIEEVVGAERERRLTEFRLRWKRGGMRRGEWAELARKWNVCDGIEVAKNCRMPAGPLDDQGTALEILGRIADGGRPRYEPSAPLSQQTVQP